MSKQTIRKLVLAYSGGLDTSVILRWLKDYLGCEVIAYCADVGQGDETEGLEQKALKTGASKLHLVDLRDEFARDFVFPMLRANAVYEGYYMPALEDLNDDHRAAAAGTRMRKCLRLTVVSASLGAWCGAGALSS